MDLIWDSGGGEGGIGDPCMDWGQGRLWISGRLGTRGRLGGGRNAVRWARVKEGAGYIRG
jgi:streptogramin lyase